MKIFISYASEDRELSERMSFTLRSESHSTFFDQQSLTAGRAFDTRIRTAIEECDLLVFLLGPNSIEPGSYALAELAIAQTKWQHPDGHILPILIQPTPIESVPPFLRSVTWVQPQGDVVAETIAAIVALSKPEWNLPFEVRTAISMERNQHKIDGVLLKMYLIAIAVIFAVGLIYSSCNESPSFSLRIKADSRRARGQIEGDKQRSSDGWAQRKRARGGVAYWILPGIALGSFAFFSTAKIPFPHIVTDHVKT